MTESTRALRIAWLVAAAGCASQNRAPDAAAPPLSPRPTEAAPAPAAPPAPLGPPVCLPVSGCNMFVGCGRAEPVRAEDGATVYRVLRYDHHPNRAGELWPRHEVCWDARGEHRCADALDYRTAICTPTPPAPMELDYACEMQADRCVVVEH